MCEKYSFLISIYCKDNPEYLKLALESMLEQTLPPSEIVVVFDGPVPRAITRVVDEVSATADPPFVIVKLEDNRGLGEALRIGVTRCSCEYIARMDSDDLCRLDRCEHQLEYMVDHDLDLLGGWIEEFTFQPGDLGAVRSVPCEINQIKAFLKRRNPFNHVTVMFKKSAVMKAGNYRPFHSVEDYWLWARMLADGARMANVPNIYVDVRVGNGMQSRRGGMKIAISQSKLLLEMHRLGLLKWLDVLIGLIIRVGGASLPASLRALIYKNLFRNYK